MNEVFQGERSRYYLFTLIGFALAASIGLAHATIWLGLILLFEETKNALQARMMRDGEAAAFEDDAANLALQIAANAALAAAPLLAWFSRAPLGDVTGLALLGALAISAALTTRLSFMRTLVVCAPFWFAALAFFGSAISHGQGAAGLACAAAFGFTYFAALRHADLALRAHAHSERENAALLAQMSTLFDAPGAVTWEADLVSQTLIGGDRLSKLIGRPINYDDVMRYGCFAAEQDRMLVRAAFAPNAGCMSRIAIEHNVDGGPRLRHQGVVRTDLEGRPVRLICVTRGAAAAAINGADAHAALHQIANLMNAALAKRSDLFKTLANELPGAVTSAPARPMRDLRGSIEDLCIAIGENLEDMARGDSMIERSIEALAHARHAADNANLAKSQFLANMSHELRTPLNAVIGYAEILQEDAEEEGNDSAAQDLTRILAAAKHLLTLLNEILDLSKIEAGRVEVAPAPFDPLDLIDDLMRTMRPLAEKNGNTLAWVGGRPAGLADTDATKLSQCVLNLLSNACKFTQDGVVEVSMTREMQNGAEHLVTTVKDTGIGMTQEHLANLFQPFVQADPSISQKYGGTGLGLTITRRFAQLLGGDVEVSSVFGHGSTFSVSVPADYTRAVMGDAPEVDALQGDSDAPLVVVIEDEPDARDLAARALTRAGFSVLGVGAGQAGVQLARSRSPALILLDIFLPDRSGWRVLQSLKQDPKTAHIPVVVLSVNEDRAKAFQLGAAEHLVKPADRDALAATVMRFARKRPERQGGGAVSAPIVKLPAQQKAT